jgi:hypothetical protein
MNNVDKLKISQVLVKNASKWTKLWQAGKLSPQSLSSLGVTSMPVDLSKDLARELKYEGPGFLKHWAKNRIAAIDPKHVDPQSTAGVANRFFNYIRNSRNNFNLSATHNWSPERASGMYTRYADFQTAMAPLGIKKLNFKHTKPEATLSEPVTGSASWSPIKGSEGTHWSTYDRGILAPLPKHLNDPVEKEFARAVLRHEIGHDQTLLANSYRGANIAGRLHKYLKDSIGNDIINSDSKTYLSELAGQWRATLKPASNTASAAAMNLPIKRLEMDYPDLFLQFKNYLNSALPSSASQTLKDRLLATRAHLRTNYGF